MIRNLISLVFFFVVGWLIYTQVLGFGTEEEKETGKELVQSAKKTLSGVFGILSNETKKFKDGTYDDAIDKLGSLLDDLRDKNKANGGDTELQTKLEELKKEEERIKDEITTAKKTKMTSEDAEAKEEQTKKDLHKLTKDIEKVLKMVKVASE